MTVTYTVATETLKRRHNAPTYTFFKMEQQILN